MVMKIEFELKKPILLTRRRSRELSGRGSGIRRSRILALSSGLWLLSVWIAWAQVAKIPTGLPSSPPQTNELAKYDRQGKSELQAGTDLTHRGLLQEAIPHLLAAQKLGSSPYATGVDLGICYVGLRRYKEAIATFNGLRSSGFNTAAVNNLLAQAYLGDGQRTAALNAFQEAASLTPKDEKLYDFVADACTDHHDFAMGLRVVEHGLQQLPDSPRLHYERALFLAQMDRLDDARPEFDRAAQLEPGSYIASLALVQEDLYDDRFAEATHRLREVVQAGHRDFRTLSLLGTVLMNIGAAPGDPEFAEAQSVLEESAKENPGYSATQIALGKIYIMEDRFGEATEHLEMARRLEPANPSIYTSLAHAYRRLGELDKAHIAQTELARMLADKRSTSASPAP